MKNKLRTIAVLLLSFGLIELLSYSKIAVKISIIFLIGFLVYGLYIFILDIMNDAYPEDKSDV